ncbi:MAG: transcription termination/antitermination protein NusG [Pseudomonadota bacterium]
MEFKWYVVHTYSGCENKAKEALLERIKAKKMDDFFDEILIPTENVVEMVKGQKKTSTRKFFPGYILVRMQMNNETWHLVKNTAKISGFVGGGTNPPSITEEEVDKITTQVTEGVIAPKLKFSFEQGESVRVIEGPFSNFNGIVEEVKPEKGKVKVMVSIFGRSTPVELDFAQVEKN